jgi:hypothetical protein
MNRADTAPAGAGQASVTLAGDSFRRGPHREHVRGNAGQRRRVVRDLGTGQMAPTSASTQPLRVLYVRAHWLEGAGLLTAGQAVKDKNFSLSIKILG